VIAYLGQYFSHFISPQGYMSLLAQGDMFDISFLPGAMSLLTWGDILAISFLSRACLGQYLWYFIPAWGYLLLLT